MSSPRIVVLSNCGINDAIIGPVLDIVPVRIVANTLVAEFASSEDTCELPAPVFFLRQYIKSDLGPWLHVLDWLARLASDQGVVVADFDHPLRELMLLGRSRGQRFGLYYREEQKRISLTEYALLSSTDFCLFSDAEAESEFRKHYVGVYRSFLLSEDCSDPLAKLISSEEVERAPEKPRNMHWGQKRKEGAKKRLLLVSYFSGSCRTVGVQRVNYWAKHIHELSAGEFEVHLATASRWPDGSENVHFVPDTEIATLLGEEQRFPAWAVALKSVEERDAKCFNTLSFYWRIALERYFETADLNFDAVIISGNPFSVFDFAAFAKRRWGAKVILDYRDPFANNPRIKFSEAARAHARYVEKGYNLQADVALTVNSVCADMVVGYRDFSVKVIGNGFNDRELGRLVTLNKTSDLIKFVHAGSFYYFGSPSPLVSVLEEGKHELHHVGKLSGVSEEVISNGQFYCHGIKTYGETLQILAEADCGIVYVSAAAFETPTKMYDYLALGLDILICTDGEPESGALGEVLRGHPNVYWCKNNEHDLAEFLRVYTPRAQDPASSNRFSRAAETQKLIDVLRSILSAKSAPEMLCPEKAFSSQ